jgi:hypothetical protein
VDVNCADCIKMRLTVFIILSSVYLNSATELHELFKLPFLITHLRHHQQEDKSLTLVDFLRIHYLGNHPMDNDDTEDSQLPFKSPGNVSPLDIFIPGLKETVEKKLTPFTGNINTFHPEGMPSHRSFPIFHPPRNV